jgi:heme-degrading monooxygenase HmoA
MTTIEEHAPLVTLINVFTVAPERASELAELLRVATEEKMRFVPGFISANIHVSTDGTRVVNYAQWQSAEAYQAMFEDPGAREHMKVCAAVATSFEPRLYTVESVQLGLVHAREAEHRRAADATGRPAVTAEAKYRIAAIAAGSSVHAGPAGPALAD